MFNAEQDITILQAVLDIAGKTNIKVNLRRNKEGKSTAYFLEPAGFIRINLSACSPGMGLCIGEFFNLTGVFFRIGFDISIAALIDVTRKIYLNAPVKHYLVKDAVFFRKLVKKRTP